MSAPVQARHLAQVIYLADRLPTEPMPAVREQRGILARLATSPAAADLRDHAWLLGLLVIPVLLFAVAVVLWAVAA